MLPTLRNKSTKKKEENGVVAQRTSKFVQSQLQFIESMLNGQYFWEKQKLNDSILEKAGKIKAQTNLTRQEQLLRAKAPPEGDSQPVVKQTVDQQMEGLQLQRMDPADMQKAAALAKNTEEGYKDVFKEWLRDYHYRYLAYELFKGFANCIFVVRLHKFDSIINPDIGGSMTKSIIDIDETLKIPKGLLSQS